MIIPSLLLALQGPRRVPVLPTPPPSVLIIVGDDIGHPEIPSMPTLQALAAQGVSFERAYGGTMCCPGRFALLYGEWPRRQGIGQNPLQAWDPLAPTLPLSLVSMAELFSKYATCLVGKDHLGRSAADPDVVWSGPASRGFQTWTAGTPVTTSFGPSASGYRDWWRVERDATGTAMKIETIYATDVQRDQFIAWWDGTPAPKYAWLSWSAGHDPFDKPPGYPVVSGTRAQYLQGVEYMDTQLATVLQHVDLATTYVVWCADNGTPNGARPIGSEFNQWKFTTFEGGIRVPLVIAGPGISQGITTQRIVCLNDVAATLAEMAGKAIKPGTFRDSVSFADELGAWAGGPERAFAFAERYKSDVIDDQAVIEASWKLRVLDIDGSDGPELPENFWYRITSPGVEVELTPGLAVQSRLLSEMASIPARVQ